MSDRRKRNLFSDGDLIFVRLGLKSLYSLIIVISLKSQIAFAIEWFEPQIGGVDSQGYVKILLAGEAEVGSEVIIDLSKIVVIRGSQSGKKLSSKKVMATTNKEGIFELKLSLPQGLMQVPVLFKGRPAQTILVLFDVSKEWVKLNVKTKKRSATTEKIQAVSPKKEKLDDHPQAKGLEYFLSLSSGGSQLNVTQNQQGANVQNLQIKSSAVRGDFHLVENGLGVEIGFQYYPINVDQVDGPFTVVNGKAKWSVVNGNVLWQIRGHKAKLLSLSRLWMGVQSHRIPFLSTNSSNQVSFVENDLIGIVLGYGIRLGSEPNWQYDVKLSYVYPVSYGSSDLSNFSLLPKLGLDFTLDAQKRFKEKYYWGGHGSLQLQNHGYSYKDRATSTVYNGEFNYLLTVLTVDLGISF